MVAAAGPGAPRPPRARGFSIGIYPGDGGAVLERLDEVAAAGATHVALVVSWEQSDVRATAIAR